MILNGPQQKELVKQLFTACGDGDAGKVRGFLQALQQDANIQQEWESEALLHIAAKKGHIKLARLLLTEFAAKVDSTDRFKITPLHLAVQHGHISLARMLVTKFSADVNKTGLYDTPVVIALRQDNVPMLRMLIKTCKAQDIREYGAAVLAHVGSEKMLCTLIDEFGLDLTPDSDGNTLLHHTANTGKENLVRTLIKRYGQKVNQTNIKGWTALHNAAYYGTADMVRLLIEEFRADVKAVTQDQQTTLHLAATRNDPNQEVIRLLVQNGVKVNAQDRFGRTAICEVIEENIDASISFLLSEGGIDCNIPDRNGLAPLHVILDYKSRLYRKEHLSIVSRVTKLIQQGKADPNVQDKAGQTPLHYCVGNEIPSAIPVLVSTGLAKVNMGDYEGKTPLHYAAGAQYKNYFSSLIGGKCSATMAKQLVLDCQAEVNVKDQDGLTPLHHAVILGSEEMVNALLQDCHADVNAQGNDGNTALHYACGERSKNNLDSFKPNLALAKHLVNFKADVNAKNSQGRAPLLIAMVSGFYEMVEILLQDGHIDANIIDSQNRSPLYYAATKGKLRLVNQLLDIPAVRDAPHVGSSLAADENYALIAAAGQGDLATLNRLLNYPEVVANITALHNCALRQAQGNHHQAVIDRLMQFEAVANFNQRRRGPERSLREIAEHRESAMAALSDKQTGVIAAIKKHYANKFRELGGEKAILANFKQYLEQRLASEPVKDDKGTPLPLSFRADLPSQVAYYHNIFHTAWRYLLRPNPWISPSAGFVEVLDEGRAASISIEDRVTFAYLWLAASDESIEPIAGFTHEAMKEAFVREIALLARAHNWDNTREVKKTKKNAKGESYEVVEQEEYDDLNADCPSCLAGVLQRLVQSVLGNPVCDTQEARELTPAVFARKFTELLISDNPKMPTNLFAKIKGMELQPLRELKALLIKFVSVHVGDKEKLDEDEKKILKQLEVAQPELDIFMDECIQWFGDKRVKALDLKLLWQDKTFSSYQALTVAFANNPGIYFYDQINTLLEGLIQEKSPVPVLIFSKRKKDGDELEVLNEDESENEMDSNKRLSL